MPLKCVVIYAFVSGLLTNLVDKLKVNTHYKFLKKKKLPFKNLRYVKYYFCSWDFIFNGLGTAVSIGTRLYGLGGRDSIFGGGFFIYPLRPPNPYTMGTGDSFPAGDMRAGRDADHSPPSRAEVKKEELYLLCSPNAFWRIPGLWWDFFICCRIYFIFFVI
jgi:hypothetical protein